MSLFFTVTVKLYPDVDEGFADSLTLSQWRKIVLSF